MDRDRVLPRPFFAEPCYYSIIISRRAESPSGLTNIIAQFLFTLFLCCHSLVLSTYKVQSTIL